MMAKISIVILAVCLTFCTSQPIEQTPLILQEAPAEVLFRSDRPFLLECIPEEKVPGVKYFWKKDDSPLKLSSSIIQLKDVGTLIFHKPSSNDEGIYQCFAESPKGIASTRKISVRRTYLQNAAKTTLKTHKPVLGKPFTLDCKVGEGYPKPQISWKLQLISEPTISRTLLDRRIHNSPDGNLWFSNITKNDANKEFKYVCVAKTPASDEDVVLAEHIIEDVVDEGPQPGQLIPQYVSQDMTAKVGDVTMIYCIYGGTPLGHPDWFKDGNNVNNSPGDRVTRYNRSSGRRLLIKDTWLEDQGTYTSNVDNGAGEPQKHEMRLTVVSAPQFTAKLASITSTKLGQDINIACRVAGVPVPKVTWTYNSNSLPKNERITFDNSISGNNTVSDLTIKNVQENDLGYYGCNGVNENGDIYSETLLTL